jgi:hypothetical protein
LKFYLYGYIHWIRSSRALERDLEVIWLISALSPSYKTIADFCQHHAEALREVHLHFIGLCKTLNLFGGTRVAVDGSFLNGFYQSRIHIIKCITDKSSQRNLWRNQHEERFHRYQERMKTQPHISRQRSALVEHSFGTFSGQRIEESARRMELDGVSL